MRSKSSSGSVCDAHWTKFPYSSLQNDLEQLIAQRPVRSSGAMLRFSTRLIPSMISSAYGPVQVKAWEIMAEDLRRTAYFEKSKMKFSSSIL